MKGSRATRQRGARSWFGESVVTARGCEWPDCTEMGDYRAPKSPNALREYRWFCLDHVREYNKGWDYFAGLDEDAIEFIRRRDTVWHRPTWPLGARIRNGADDRREPFGFCAEGGEAAAPRPDTPRDNALAQLGLDRDVTLAELKSRYKALVKRHHPDANGGSKASEERIKSINEAYTYLLNAAGA